MPIFKKNIHLGTKDPLWQTDDIEDKSITMAKLAPEVKEKINSHFAPVVVSITGDGVLTDSNGNKFLLTPYVEPATIVSEDYGTPTVELSYAQIPSSGGTVYPVLSYSQIKTMLWSDDSVTTETITSGASIEYTGASNANGLVTANASTSASVGTVANVTVKVTLNGKVAAKTVQVKQAAMLVTYDYYIGMIQSNASNFAALTAEELAANATKFSISQDKSASYVAKKSCVFLLIPTSHLSLTKMQFTSQGITTDILGGDAWNLSHDNVTIDSVEYKILGYRSGGISDSDPLTFDYTVKYTA